VGQRHGERPEAGSDLEDPLARAGSGELRDPPGKVRVGQEVLAERLGRTDAVPGGELLQGPAPERPLTR